MHACVFILYKLGTTCIFISYSVILLGKSLIFSPTRLYFWLNLASPLDRSTPSRHLLGLPLLPSLSLGFQLVINLAQKSRLPLLTNHTYVLTNNYLDIDERILASVQLPTGSTGALMTQVGTV